MPTISSTPFVRRSPLPLLLAAVLILPASLSAQQTAIAAEAGLVDARDFTGFTAMGAFEARSFVLFGRGSVDIGFGGNDTSVEQRGDTCYDVDENLPVNDSRCVSLDGGITLRGGLDFPIQGKRLQLGIGYRLAKSQSGVVGSASLRIPRGAGWWGVTLEIGDEIVRATGGIGFSLFRPVREGDGGG